MYYVTLNNAYRYYSSPSWVISNNQHLLLSLIVRGTYCKTTFPLQVTSRVHGGYMGLLLLKK